MPRAFERPRREALPRAVKEEALDPNRSRWPKHRVLLFLAWAAFAVGIAVLISRVI